MGQWSKLHVFHPSPNLVEVVDDLLAEANVSHENIVEPGLLDRAIEDGITPEIREEIARIVSDIPPDPPSLVFCTCSTLGGVAEEIGQSLGRDVLRIDRPMAEEAVRVGRRIGVAAALESTLAPTRELLEQVAADSEANVEITIIHCKAAWEHKQRGDNEAYLDEVAHCLDEEARDLDVVVLAQGSMAGAKDRTSLTIPVLSSPELGVDRVASLMEAA